MMVRLSKLMSEKGICSRREADLYIEKGLVSVDGVVVDTLGTKVSPDAKIELSREASDQQNSKVTILLNKPLGYVSTQPEKGYHPAIELITPENQDPQFEGPRLKASHLKKLSVAGRLDINSKGLLIFTQDGTLAKAILGENNDLEKEYLVRFRGTISEGKLKLLRHGMILDEKRLKPAVVEQINQYQLRFILKEGRKRQIRRMCEIVELEVLSLKRVRVGNIKLGKLKEGFWRFLSDKEKL